MYRIYIQPVQAQAQLLSIIRNEPQLFCGCPGLRPALHVQLVEDVADVGLHGRQLHIHDLRDLGVGLVRAEQMQNLQLRGRQLLAGGKAGFEKMRVDRRLRPHRRQSLAPPLVPLAVQGNGSQDIQVNAVDDAGAVLDVRLQRGKRQACRPQALKSPASDTGSVSSH